ncbi:MAG: FUSC family protein [Synechococcaceae cyanobacterium]|nr:FUSC family protein [Synechococcaceae cyanobacterium]
MSPRSRMLLQVLLAVAALVLSDRTAWILGIGQAAGLLCLTSLATLVICARLGWRQALLGVVGLALLTIPAALSQSDPFTATIVMMLSAFCLGLSARWQLQQVYWLLIVSLCLVITNSPLRGAPMALDLARLAAAVLISGGLTILLQSRLPARTPATESSALFPVAHSWRRSAAYGLLLAITTLVSTPVAVQNHWHIAGLWLILTPFLGLRPFVRDSWKVALHRSLGTVAGVLMVLVLAVALPRDVPLQVPAIALAVITLLIANRHGHPAWMLMALTATIVLFNSTHADLLEMADRRVQASAIGVGIALALMAIARPIERCLFHNSVE